MGKFLGLFGFVFILVLFFFAVPQTVQAASLVNTSDQISTSRPSPASYLTANAASSDVSISVANNGSRFLASDSAKIIRTSTAATLATNRIVASQSAALTTVYLTGTAGSAASLGTDVLMFPITAVHKVQFTTQTAVPGSGKVIITFPTLASADTNAASPSAQTFMFNGLASGNITVTGATCSTWTISAPSITCNLNASGIGGLTTVAFYIGCTAVTSGACSTSVPTLINPTSSLNAVSGNTSTADTWKVSVATQDSAGGALDSATTRIGTIASVQVQAQIDPTITFTIAGATDSATINTLVPGCGSNTDVTNSGIGSTSTFVNLGILSNGAINKSAQVLTVSTNSSNGYSLTATSSGRLINAGSGFALNDTGALTANDTPAPATFPASGNTWFGIHACGNDSPGVNSDQWAATAATGFSSGAKFANPWNSGAGSYVDTLATYSGGPANARATVAEYAATVGGTTPAGIYTTVLTYIATATF